MLSTPAELGPHLAKFGLRMHPPTSVRNLPQMWPDSGPIWPNSTRSGPNSSVVGNFSRYWRLIWAVFGATSIDIGQNWLGLDQFCTDVGPEFDRNVAEFD